MPLVFELIVLALTAYVLGLALGWLAWGRSDAAQADQQPVEDREMER